MASTGTRARPRRPPVAHPGRFLPPDPRVESPYRFTPQLALRIAILGAVALAFFGVLFFRLWALQVLSGPHYLRAALDNQLRSVRVEAPRGQILDDKGRPLVTNVAGTAVQLHPTDLPKTWAARLDELKRLSKVVHVPVREMLRELKQRGNDPVTPVVVREDVKRTAPINYLYEHAEDFPGVTVTNTFLRSYPYGSLAAHVLGYVNEISPEQLKTLQPKGYAPGDKIGQAGVESTYDSYLRGRAGIAQLRVDSLGRPRSRLETKQPAVPGESLELTLDIDLQRAAERAIVYGIHKANADGKWAANGGAIVALDPRDGSIRALASYPTFEPKLYTGHVSMRRLRNAGLAPSTAEQHNYPSVDRAISGVYPAGSTFKPVTALAALQTGLISPSTELPCTGYYTVYNEYTGQVDRVFYNWDRYVDTPMTLPTAIAASCDTFFYRLGYSFYKLPPSDGHPLQAWAARFGIGRKTGVDIGPESAGLLPTPEWRKRTFTSRTDPRNWRIDSTWKSGDSIQLTIGQKDLLVTPLQMARFYALVANGGKLVRPHLAQRVQEGGGNARSPARIVHRFAPPAPQPVGLDPTYLAAVQDGLYQATHSSFGTSSAVFGSFPITIAGKTGTAEKIVKLPGYTGPQDQSWWCGYGPAAPGETPELVVCALIENGGHGGDAAAPAALKVFEQYFHRTATTVGAVHSD